MPRPALAKLQRDFELKAYTFDADLYEVAPRGARSNCPISPRDSKRPSAPP